MALVPFPSASPGRPDEDPQIELTDAEFEDDSARRAVLKHLDGLRKRLIYSVYSLIAGCAVAYRFVGKIQRDISMPLFEELQGTKFMYTSGFEPFMLTMKIGALAGLMLASPLIIYQLWLFIAPGLYA